jgi:hypothetical protein
MNTLEQLFQTIDQLDNHELNQIEQYIDQRRQSIHQSSVGVEDRLVALHMALAEFREGFTNSDWEVVAAAMNDEYIKPNDVSLFDWLDDVPEEER